MSQAAPPAAPNRRRSRRTMAIWTLLGIFLLPVFGAAGALAYRGGPTHWSQWDRTVVSRMPSATAHPEARVMVLAQRTRGWKGVLAVHSWIVIKGQNEKVWRRYDVAGWGTPLRLNWWPPDLWFGDYGNVVLDIKGERAQALIPRIEATIKDYRYVNSGDYRIWPGPNSNSFVAAVLRSVPELGVSLPPNAIGRDFRPWPYAGLTDSRTGVEANLWGVLGIKLGWVEGLEFNLLGLVAGVDIRNPAVKLPGYGRVGLDHTATAATKPEKPL